MQVADRYWGDRSEYAYAFNTLQQFGTHIAFGSDAPVESPNPFWGIHASVTRQRHDGTPGVQGWRPSQRISVENAINAYTQGASFAVSLEACQGKIQPGYYADLIALDHDPYSYPIDQLYRLSPVKTMVGGEWVWQA
jgi:predicted amidohydrolase YtcJ